MAKADCWTVTDAEARKRGEQTGLDTLVAGNDGFIVEINQTELAKNNLIAIDRKSTRLNSSH